MILFFFPNTITRGFQRFAWERSQAVYKDIDDFVQTFNNITSNIRKFTDDGGRLYFPAVVALEMNRACCSVTA